MVAEGGAVTIQEPRVFWVLLVLVPVALVQWRELVRGRRDLKLLYGQWQHQEVMNLFLVKWFFSSLFFNIALFFLVLAAAGFSWGQEPIEEDRRGLDIAIAADISRSMLAADIAPSRLDRSRSVMRALLQEFPGARFSATMFKGHAVTAIPLTADTVALDGFIDALHPNMFSSTGTNIEAGIRAAYRSFYSGSSRHRVIVIFTDGESLDGVPVRAAREAAASGVPIFVVAAGTEAGAPIILADGSQVRDERNAVVVTRLDLDAVSQIATVSGGGMIRLQDGDAFSRLVAGIRSHEAVMTSEGFRLVPVERFRFFLFPALFSLICYSAIRVIRWKELF
ncbi:MAG: VWA domain-containing protein [Spirochaetaceae bacterium]|nr:MAG: VWA domain-containing protein [Spirochaetaceae bacterium]